MPTTTTREEDDEEINRSGDNLKVEDSQGKMGSLTIRSSNEVKEIQKEIKKAEKQAAVSRIKNNIVRSGQPVREIREIIREKPGKVIKEVKEIIKEKGHHHHHDPIYDESESLDCKGEVKKIKKELHNEIKNLKDQLKNSKNKKSSTVSDIEKRNIKILLKELLANKILTKEEVEDINKSVKNDNLDLSEIIKALEKLRNTTSSPTTFHDSHQESHSRREARKNRPSYGDMKYDELPDDKRIPLGDQLPPDDWENEYTLLNTDKWAVPKSHPPLCIASNNLDPLPSNDVGYPLSLKEWDNSRVISNSYINKKWAMDQIDTSMY